MENELSNQQISEFLKAQPLVKGMTDSELSYLVDMSELIVYGPGEVIFPEGENSNDIYFIHKGEVSIIQMDTSLGKEQTLGVLKAGEAFGDLAFLDDSPRSSTIKTNTETELLRLSKESSYAQSMEMASIYNKILRNTAKINIARLRNTNQTYIEKISVQANHFQKIINHGKLFLIAVLLYWGMGILVSGIDNRFLADSFRLFAVSGVLYFLISRFFPPLSHFGMTIEGWKKSLQVGAATSCGLIAIFVLLYSTGLFFDFVNLRIKWIRFSQVEWSWSLLIFPFAIFLMEFILRGVIQTSLKDFLQNVRKSHSIVYTAAIISFLSLPLGIKWLLPIFLVNSLLGYLYNRYPQLLGVTLVHITIGFLLVLLGLMPQDWLLRV